MSAAQNGGRGNYANDDGSQENEEGQEDFKTSRIRSANQRGGCHQRGKGVGGTCYVWFSTESRCTIIEYREKIPNVQ